MTGSPAITSIDFSENVQTLGSAAMELRHLRYFVVVAETLSFTKGAEKLHLAQPTLTRQIKDLENELDVWLVDRRRSIDMLNRCRLLVSGRCKTPPDLAQEDAESV